jgi:hypothetical protein
MVEENAQINDIVRFAEVNGELRLFVSPDFEPKTLLIVAEILRRKASAERLADKSTISLYSTPLEDL